MKFFKNITILQLAFVGFSTQAELGKHSDNSITDLGGGGAQC